MRQSQIVLAMWLACVGVFAVYAADRNAPAAHVIAATLAFALLMGLYLLFSQRPAAERVVHAARDGGEYGLPGFLWIIFVVLRLTLGGDNALLDIVLAGAMIWLPTTLVVNSRAALTPIHAAAGLSALIVPLGIDVVLGARPGAAETMLRAGAFALPVILIALTTRAQKSRLSFLFIAGVCFLWFGVEFGNGPKMTLPFNDGRIGYLHFASIVLLLYLLAWSGRLADAGYTFALSRKDWIEAAVNLGAIALSVLPIGLLTSFIRPSTALPSLADIAGGGIAIFFFIALPEELLFRGVIHRYLQGVLRWSPRWTLLLSSVLFGAAHLDNPPNVGWYFLLAGIAGWFYGRTYLRTGKIVPAAIVHWMVDWIWSVFFAG